ncbi:hypothetical protein EBR66_05990 [bacterium]|nr:hypothetical protein [bacterium]
MKRPSRVRSRNGTQKMRGGTRGNIYVFYHIYCNNNTIHIMGDQVGKIIFSGLYKAVTHVYCFLTGKASAIQGIQAYIQTLPKKFIVADVGVDDTSYERFTLNRISKYLKDSDKFLYIHSKGVSRVGQADRLSSIIYLWRTFMEYFLIAHFRECLEKLQTYDIVGAAYKTEKIGPHYSGNFWWSTGAYFKRLYATTPIGSSYHDPESYIFKASPKAYAIDGDLIKNNPMYNNELLPKYYMDKHFL